MSQGQIAICIRSRQGCRTYYWPVALVRQFLNRLEAKCQNPEATRGLRFSVPNGAVSIGISTEGLTWDEIQALKS